MVYFIGSYVHSGPACDPLGSFAAAKNEREY